jgi:hypothetical protein
MAETIGYLDPKRALRHLQSALPRLRLRHDLFVVLRARHALAWCLAATGQGVPALIVLDLARPLYRQFRDAKAKLQLHWLEGRIARAMHETETAAPIFTNLYDEYTARDLRQERLLVTLDLAETLVEQANVAAAAAAVARLQPSMAGWGLHAPALAAWDTLQSTLGGRDSGHAAGRRAAQELLARLQIYFRQHWHTPAELP